MSSRILGALAALAVGAALAPSVALADSPAAKTTTTTTTTTTTKTTGAPRAPDEILKTTTAQIQDIIKKRQAEFRTSRKALYDMVNQQIVPHFDVRYIAQLVLAKNWRKATDEQKTRFQSAFKDMLIRSYADALLENADSVKAEWQPLRAAAGATDVVVQSKLMRTQGQPVPIGFAMRLKNNEWKVYDIIIENLSLVTNFKAQVASKIKQNGLDAVIKELESGGALVAPQADKPA